MERIPDSRYSELIEEAYSAIPDNIVKLVRHVHFFCGTDPVYAGLVKDQIIPLIKDGKQLSSRNWMYYLCGRSCDWRSDLPISLLHPTIFIPYWDPILFGLTDVVHELGHVLDDCFRYKIPNIEDFPVTEYAKTNYAEAFAEAFTSWLFWDYGEQLDPSTLDFFESLKKGVSVE